MTKSQEIQIIREAIEKLGVHSYCGPWLADQLPAIEFAIDADDCVESRALGFTESRHQSAAILREAKAESDRILASARKEADQIRAKANQFDDQIRAELGRSIQAILNRL